MTNRLYKNKKGSIQILILVVLTLILVLAALTVFFFKPAEMGNSASTYSLAAGQVYLREKELNYYLQDVFDSAALTLKKEDANIEQSFILTAKEKISKSKIGDNYVFEEIKPILAQLDESRVSLREDKIIVELDIVILKTKEIKKEEQTSVLYKYKKKFESKLNSGGI
jgi:flagellar basal body-associated protein FliL